MTDGPRRVAFALGTFHTAVLVVAVVMFVHSRDGLGALSDLNTAAGLALFALLWAASVAGTRWALRGVRQHSFDVAMRRGIGGGAIAGLLVLAPLVVFGALGSVAFSDDPLGRLWVGLVILAFFGVVGGIFAAVIGGAVGFLFAIVDWVILGIAGIGDGWDPREEALDG